MKLASLINPDCVVIGSHTALTETAIQQLFQTVYKHYQFEIPRETALQALLEREKIGGTVMPGGIAIPHARIEGLNDLVIAAMTPLKPIPSAGENVRVIFLILTSKTASKSYLNTLAAIAQIGKNPELMEKLSMAKTPHQFLELINVADIRIKKELTVIDIAAPDFPTVTPETNLRDLCNLFVKTYVPMIPVVDASGKLVGEVTTHDLLKKTLPNYAMMMENLAFLSSFEPFEEFLSHETDYQVKEIMRKPEHVLKPASSVIEAAHEMAQHHLKSMSILSEGRVVGVVSHWDLLFKVLRG